MKTLGISAFYHDSAAALVVDDKVLAACHEERFSRLKHDADFPVQSIQYCLQTANCELSELDAIVFYDKPFLKFERIFDTYLHEVPFGFSQFYRSLPIWANDKLRTRQRLNNELKKMDVGFNPERLFFSEHHFSHAASAFFPSPFANAAVLTLDGVGEWATTGIFKGENRNLTLLEEIRFPHSLGLFYSAFTLFCGFKVNSGEYKLMGLAPLGNPVYVDKIKSELINLHADGSFSLNMKYFGFTRGLQMINRNFEKFWGQQARSQSITEISSFYKDIAASVQKVTEEAILALAKRASLITDKRNLCLAGGVALNCVANSALRESGIFENIWIQPAAGDAGGSLGAALLFNQLHLSERRVPQSPDAMQYAYLGPEPDTKTWLKEMEKLQLNPTSFSNEILLSKASSLLADGKIIGVCRGRMEFGPRALGNRSILANPSIEGMQRTLNLKTKFREDFRPFAPIANLEKAHLYFDNKTPSPYMLFTCKGLNNADEIKLGAVLHRDGSARLQTVSADSNPFLHSLLNEFEQKAGFGVLVNTSFNVRGEPMVNTAMDAWNCFLHSGIDALLIDSFFIEKADLPQNLIGDNWAGNFTPD